MRSDEVDFDPDEDFGMADLGGLSPDGVYVDDNPFADMEDVPVVENIEVTTFEENEVTPEMRKIAVAQAHEDLAKSKITVAEVDRSKIRSKVIGKFKKHLGGTAFYVNK